MNLHADGMAYCLLNAPGSFDNLIQIHVHRLRGHSFIFVNSSGYRALWRAIHTLSAPVANSSLSPRAMRMRHHRERMKLGAVLVAHEPSV